MHEARTSAPNLVTGRPYT